MTRLGATVFAGAIWLLFRTLRLDCRADTPSVIPYSETTQERFFYCVWHDSMIIPAFGGKHRCMAALTSRHADGSFVAAVVRLLGVSAVRGSTNHIGPGTLRELMKATKDKHIIITPDGPRGPRRQMSKGIVFLASRTGRGVVPTAYSCSRCWSVGGGWTDLVIPKPFAKVFLLAGDPVRVPPGLGRDELQPYAALIQTEMDRLNAEANRLSAR